MKTEAGQNMNLKIVLPMKIFLEVEANKVTAEAQDGSFCLLPRHIDLVAAIVPGIFSFESGGKEEFLAVDEGVLVKRGPDVIVSTRKAIGGRDLGDLKDIVEKEFRVLDEQERKTRSILARLEADFARRFFKLRE